MAVATPAQGIAEKVSAMIEEQELTCDDVLGYLRQMMEIRALENQIAEFLGKAVLKGASHLYAGEEAVAVGAVGALVTTIWSPAHTAATVTRTRMAINSPRHLRLSRNTTTR